MLHLELVEDNGFQQRKKTKRLDECMDPNFEGLIHRMFELSFLYTFESCYGVFDGLEEDRSKRHMLRDQRTPVHYLEGFTNFGLDVTHKARQFLEGLKKIIRANRQNTHLADSYPYHHGNTYFKPNEFHFGVMPMNGKDVRQLDEGVHFGSWQEAKDFEVVRDKIWRELGELVRGYQ